MAHGGEETEGGIKVTCEGGNGMHSPCKSFDRTQGHRHCRMMDGIPPGAILLVINVESCAISQEKGNKGCCMWKQLVKVPQVDIFAPELNGASPAVAGRNCVFTHP